MNDAITIMDALDGDQLMADIEALSKIGRSENGELHRLAYSPADREGREWVESQMRQLHMDVRQDSAGSTIGLYLGTEPDLPPIAIGSHTDTVPNGGKYDGALGVLAGLAVVRTLHQLGIRLNHSIEVINFAAEEATLPGATFASRAMAGTLPESIFQQRASDGRLVSDYVQDAGLMPAGILNARREQGSLSAFLELHIEQGARLYNAQIPVGIVTGIVSIRRYHVTTFGHANHAGTTLMPDRDDALLKATELIVAIRDIALKYDIVGTTGTVDVTPNAPNVVPGKVDMTMELRALDKNVLDTAENELKDRVRVVDGEISPISSKPAVHSDPQIVEVLEATCQTLGVDSLKMASGAGHDAMCMATIAPEAMIFVPSKDGISHHPSEYTTPEHCILGAKVLLGALLQLDQL